ncbi:hypothetical protein [Sediminibacterium soli]|uniref:hypothetical protein n=1 Tax=Sediminibacterium soli TaxID=2698829 RepID=UPI001379E34D|nr:hypothetical protein [Sediminibacterium soli]NCI47831.1 hypothetical protein [Sediminibacterium soli]
MEGKYISTSLILAILGNGRGCFSLEVTETTADTRNHELVWTKQSSAANKKATKDRPGDAWKNTR